MTFEQTLKLLAMQRHGSVALYQYQTPKKGFPGKSNLCVCFLFKLQHDVCQEKMSSSLHRSAFSRTTIFEEL